MRQKRFTFLCNEDERLLIAILADKLQRSQSDAVRFVVNNAGRKLLDKGDKETPSEPAFARGVEDG